MGLKVTNNAFGTLNAGINSSVTTVVLSAGEGARFPTLTASDYFYATLIDTSNNLEIVKVTARSTDTMTIVRAQDNTTARAFSTNDRFELRPTAALFNEKANDADVTTSLATKVNLAGDSMTGQLNVHNSTQTNFASTLAESVSRATVKLRNHSTDSTLITLGGITGGDAYIQRSNGTGTTEYDIRLNPFGGRVLTPNQPAYATTGTNYTQTSGGYSKIIPSAESFDIGSNYALATGRFTAPVAGVYLFGFYGLSYPQGASDVSEFRWYKNGSGFGDNVQFGGISNNHVLCAGSIQMNLSASDYVELFFYGAGSAKAYGSQWHMWGRLCG